MYCFVLICTFIQKMTAALFLDDVVPKYDGNETLQFCRTHWFSAVRKGALREEKCLV